MHQLTDEFLTALSAAGSIGEARRLQDELAAGRPVEDDIEVRRERIGGVEVEWVTAPGGHSDRVLLVIHGGGFRFGSLSSHRRLLSHLARRTGWSTLGIDYRLAPEHPFPAAAEDVRAVHDALVADPDIRHLAIAGDSAGGALAAGLVFGLREADTKVPSALVLLGPWLDLTVSGSTFVSNASTDPLVSTAGMRSAAEMYLDGVAPLDPAASPLFASLEGFPPVLLQASSSEALLDDSRRFAARLLEAGAEARLEVYPELVHGWHQYADFLPEAAEAIDSIAAFLERVATD
ncbi:MAG: alpha/beta hydrolase [Mycetocola sp.]